MAHVGDGAIYFFDLFKPQDVPAPVLRLDARAAAAGGTAAGNGANGGSKGVRKLLHAAYAMAFNQSSPHIFACAAGDTIKVCCGVMAWNLVKSPNHNHTLARFDGGWEPSPKIRSAG